MAVTAIDAPSSVAKGTIVTVDVTVENQGTFDEVFDVTLVSDNGTPSDTSDDIKAT